MRFNAELGRLDVAIKPLQDQIDALTKAKEPFQKKMVELIQELCREGKVPEDAIKAGQCTPKPQLSKNRDGKDVIEFIWTKPKAEQKSDK